MTNQIKCPHCENEFGVPLKPELPIKAAKLQMAVTLCPKCGAPLVQYNYSDNWEILKPDDLLKLPAEIREQVSAIIADALEVNMNKILGIAPEPVTPFTRAQFFMSKNDAVAEGCVVLIGRDEWDSFAGLTKLKDRADMKDALMEVATHELDQKMEAN